MNLGWRAAIASISYVKYKRKGAIAVRYACIIEGH